MQAADRGKNYNVVIACAGLQDGARLVNNKNYPEIADDFAKSIKVYRSLPVDVFLASHSWFFDLAGKYKRLSAGANPNPYIDPSGYKAWIDSMQRDYDTMLAEQRKNPPTN
jgi:metallo-beta-lactamase class B